MKKIVLLILSAFVWNVNGICAPSAESFSVSPEMKVIFSKGNVQYHPKKNLWRFAPNQYDVIGEKNAKVSPSYNGWIDLFGWGTGNQPCLTADSYTDYSNFVDWGTNFAEEGANWRTLTQKEWEYLLYKRENASKLLGIGNVAGILGFLILPDGVNASDIEIDFISLADQGIEKKGRSYSSINELVLNKYEKKQWDMLERLGVVFLPFAGQRNTKTILKNGEVGYYWSSEEDFSTPFRSYNLSLSKISLNLIQPISKQIGCAVRLVNTIK